MKNVFICAPYRADTIQGVIENIKVARAAAVEVAKLGHYPVCPHLNTGLFEQEEGLDSLPDCFWLRGARKMLVGCDAVFIVTPDNTTAGMMDELIMASDLGIFTTYELNDLAIYFKPDFGAEL